MALDVEAATAGAAGELGVLPRRDGGVRLAVPLVELLDHDRAGRHVDAEREGLGREDDLAQPADVELLDALLEGRQHPGVVGGDAAGQPVEEVVVAEHLQVVGRAGGGRRSSTYAKISSRSSGVVSRMPAFRHWVTAASQPTRLKTKTIAGSSPSRSSRSMTSTRLGIQTRRPLPTWRCPVFFARPAAYAGP